MCTGTLLDVAGRLLGEPAVLYKEKINYKLPGGAGYSAHQDAPAYPMISAHVSAMIAIDDADETNGGLEVVSDHFDAVLPTDARGCIEPAVAASLDWLPVAVPAGSTLWFHSRTPHRSAANRSSSAAPGALPHLQRRVRGRPQGRVLRGRSRPPSPEPIPVIGRWCR